MTSANVCLSGIVAFKGVDQFQNDSSNWKEISLRWFAATFRYNRHTFKNISEVSHFFYVDAFAYERLELDCQYNL